jgi:ribose 5-phosphate isomerase B
MTANKYPGIRAALVWQPELAALARAHNDANVLCLPARFITEDDAVQCVQLFLNTDFEGGRHANRVAKITRTNS